MLLFYISLCGIASSIAYRSIDPLVTELSREFSVPVAIAALASSAYALPFALSQPVLGPIGDTFGKGRLLAICLSILTLTLIALPFATSFDMLIALRLIGGLAAGGTMPVALALVGDLFPPATRQLAIARFVAAALLGQICASALSGLLAEIINWRVIFFVSAVISGLAALGAALKLTTPKNADAPRARLIEAYQSYPIIFRNPKSYLCYGGVFLEAIAVFGILPYIAEILESHQLGGPKEAGVIIAGLGVGGILFSFALTFLMRFFGRTGLLALGGGLGSLGLLISTIIPVCPIFFILIILLGFGFGMLHNTIQTEVSSLAPQARSAAFSVHAFSFFLGQALGPVIFGFGLHHLGLTPIILFHGLLLAVVGFGAAHLFARQSGELQ
jgi:predicted MFS family arabinose efflux permease